MSFLLSCLVKSLFIQKMEKIISMNSLVQLVDDINPDMIETAQKLAKNKSYKLLIGNKIVYGIFIQNI